MRDGPAGSGYRLAIGNGVSELNPNNSRGFSLAFIVV